jgi:uncharacterized protein YyaL (SSP411 family)
MYKQVMMETLHFMLGRLQAPEGGFYSGLHSVTDGPEGSFYTWQYDELRQTLEPAGLLAHFAEAFGVTEWGNFEGGANHLKLEDAEQGWALRQDPTVYEALPRPPLPPSPIPPPHQGIHSPPCIPGNLCS